MGHGKIQVTSVLSKVIDSFSHATAWFDSSLYIYMANYTCLMCGACFGCIRTSRITNNFFLCSCYHAPALGWQNMVILFMTLNIRDNFNLRHDLHWLTWLFNLTVFLCLMLSRLDEVQYQLYSYPDCARVYNSTLEFSSDDPHWGGWNADDKPMWLTVQLMVLYLFIC